MWATTSYNGVPSAQQQKAWDVQKINGAGNDLAYGYRFHMYSTSDTYMGIFTSNKHPSATFYFNPDIEPTIEGGTIISYEYSNNADVCTIVFTVDNCSSTIIDFHTVVGSSYGDPCMVFKIS